MAHLSLQLFGTVQARLDGRLITRFEYKKVRALLAYLALEVGRPLERDHLIGVFWPDLSEGQARQNLSQALLNLRESIEDRRADPPYLSINRDTIQFNRESDYELDVQRFSSLLSVCDTHNHRHWHTCTPCARRLIQALDLYQADFLDQFFIGDCPAFDEWAMFRREGLRQRVFTALNRLVSYFEWRRDYEQAIAYARRLLELDPWREEVHRLLMGLLASSGQRGAALAQFEACRQTLKKELGAEPEDETRALFERFRNQSGAENQAGKPSEINQQPPSNLPVPTTPLIGRQAEIAAIQELLFREDVRLVTLTGAPGIGKTRLGIETAASLRADFEDGIFWINLAALGQGDLVIPAIVQTLGVPENTGASPMAVLIKFLKDKQLLLLLDNFEQILDAAPGIATVLESCADVKVLVTSRVALRIRAEQRYPVALLPEKDAIALFIDRARAILPEFQLTDNNASLLTSICARLDGLPLAIELIAARVGMMPLNTLAAELDRQMALLSDGPPDLPQRQQTLRNAIDWSYALLSADEQMLFTRLGVFVGGCTAEAIQAVCDPEHLMLNSAGILAALVHNSLVQIHTGQNRYILLESIRQYSLERLEAAGEFNRHCRRHRDWCLSVADTADREWRENQNIEVLDQLEREHDNLRAALKWNQANPQEAEIFLQLARRLWRFWDRRSYFSEGYHWLSAAFTAVRSIPADPGFDGMMADAQEGAGYLAWRLGDASAARQHLETSLTLYQAAGFQLEAASVLNTLGLVAWGQADHAQARSYYEQSRNLYFQSNDQFGLARVLNNQGILDFEQGNYAAAKKAYEQSLALMRQLNKPLAMAWILLNLGSLAHSTGDLNLAHQYYEECLVIERQYGEKADIALTLTNMAEIAFYRGDYPLARSLGEESLKLRREVEDKPGLVPSLIIMGRIEQHDGHYSTAHDRLIESLTICHSLGNALLTASTLEQIAKLAFAQGKAVHTAKLFAKADTLREEAKTPRLPIESSEYEWHIRTARDLIGESSYTREWELGGSLSYDQVLAVALDANNQ